MTTTALVNGALPDSALVVADVGPRGPQRLSVAAAASIADAKAHGMPSGCLRSGYRNLAEQAAEVADMKAGKTPFALDPGKSDHGWGIAGDWDDPARSWLRTRPEYGWRFEVPREPWHGKFYPALYTHHPATPAPPAQTEETDDMLELVKQLYLTLRGRAGSPDEWLGWLASGDHRTSADLIAAFRGVPADRGTVVQAYKDGGLGTPTEDNIRWWLNDYKSKGCGDVRDAILWEARHPKVG